MAYLILDLTQFSILALLNPMINKMVDASFFTLYWGKNAIMIEFTRIHILQK